MKSIKEFFYCGNISIAKTFRVSGFKNNYDIIIPFFSKYKVEGVKDLNFLDRLVAEIINNKEHLTQKGYSEVIKIKQGIVQD